VHEDFSREERIEISSERAFGLVIASVVAVFAFLPLLHTPLGTIRWWLLSTAILFAALALFWTKPLRPLNKAWLKLALLLFKIVSPVVLALLFFCCVAPIGWLMRMTGKDPLRLRIERTGKSYWIIRESPPGSIKNLF